MLKSYSEEIAGHIDHPCADYVSGAGNCRENDFSRLADRQLKIIIRKGSGIG